MRPLVAAIVGALACCTVAACAALSSDAQKVQAPLAAGCSFLEAETDNNPDVDFACASAEAADNLVAQLPSGQASASATTATAADGGVTVALWHVHWSRHKKVADGGPG